MQVSELTHFNRQGEAHMVDVGEKQVTHRVAVATGQITMQAQTLDKIRAGDHHKGDVLGIARLAGIMGAKRTADLIPLCHPLSISAVELGLEIDPSANCVRCTAQVETHARTGVEMEALTAVQVALLTVYDMCKAIDRGMRIDGVSLLEKRGGRSGDWQASAAQN